MLKTVKMRLDGVDEVKQMSSCVSRKITSQQTSQLDDCLALNRQATVQCRSYSAEQWDVGGGRRTVMMTLLRGCEGECEGEDRGQSQLTF